MAFGDLVQSKSNGGSGISEITVTLDATATSGNLLVLMVGYRSDRTQSATPSGWTRDFDYQRTTSSGDLRADHSFYYKISDGTETAVTVALTATGWIGASVHEYVGPWPADPTDVNSSADVDTAATEATGATAETAEAVSVAVTLFYNFNGGTTDLAAATGFTIREEFANSTASQRTADKVLSATETVEATWSYTGDDKLLTASVAVYSGAPVTGGGVVYYYGSKIPWDQIKFNLAARKRKKVIPDLVEEVKKDKKSPKTGNTNLPGIADNT